MTRNRWIAMALGALGLAGGAALWAGSSTARQATCAASDVPCRLTQIEASLARIERAVGAVATPVARGQVSMATDLTCTGESYCRQRAIAVCQESGFARGVPSDLQLQPGYRDWYRLAEVTCLD